MSGFRYTTWRSDFSQLEAHGKAMQLEARDPNASPGSGGGHVPILHLEGQASLLEEPTLAHDLGKIRALFRALDEKERLLSVLDKALTA